ncbi:esterase [soil metagenome]
MQSTVRWSALVASFVVVLAGCSTSKEPGPLVIERQGSFFVGGRIVETTALTGDPTGGPYPPNTGHVTVDQMYVQFQVPANPQSRLSIVMIPGGTLSAKSYETTPDGRMGWNEYFVRKGFAAYVVDQVSRGRSGFDSTAFNEVKMGKRAPGEQPGVFRISHETGWTWWRIGPSYGVPFPDTQFPFQNVAELQKQAVPDVNEMLPAANPTFDNLARLATQVNGAVLIGHSQSAFFPERAAFIDASGIKGIVSLETGACPASFSTAEIAKLTGTPILMLFGDHVNDAAAPFTQRWKTSLANCRNIAASINAAGGNMKLIELPELGIRGNSHFLMLDRNSHQIADLIIDWIRANVR